MEKVKKLLKLFLSMLYISAFTFGGGFVISTFMKKKFVDELHWIDEDEMLDLIALAQSSPGAIAVNVSILVGKRVGGVTGIFVAVLGTVIPPMAIILIVSLFYNAFASNKYIALLLKGMQAGVAAVIADVCCDLGKNVIKSKSALHIAIMLISFTAVFFFKVNVIIIIASALLIGVIDSLILLKGGKAK